MSRILDATPISILIRDSRARRREGHSLEPLARANSTITRTLEITGLPGALVIHTADDANAPLRMDASPLP
jgi:hypothetical protein